VERARVVAVAATFLSVFIIPAQGQRAVLPCEACAEWNRPQAPFQIFANTYYVGPRGLSAILITSNQGHVLIDGALPESAAAIASSVRALGFKVEDIRLILNSHAHFDHAGGIAELQRTSGAAIAATPWSASVLASGDVPPSDPQFGVVPLMAPAKNVRTVSNGEVVRVGPLSLTAHETPGHTPGGTSWTWSSCSGADCANFVYADSLSAVSRDGFLFSRNKEYPNAVTDFERSFKTLESVPCGILLTPHPETSGLWQRVERRAAGEGPGAMIDPAACRRYVDGARERLHKRLSAERATI
jgi:metallo-beta-lactamase class B